MILTKRSTNKKIINTNKLLNTHKQTKKWPNT